MEDNEGVGGSNHEQRSACISPASSQGGIYPVSQYFLTINYLFCLFYYNKPCIGGISRKFWS